MAKDSFWFAHDSNAQDDIKLMKIRRIYSFWGIGLYWCIVERLRATTEYQWPDSPTDMGFLCETVNCLDEAKFMLFIADTIRFELFTRADGQFFSQSLIDRMRKWDAKKRAGSQGGKRSGEARAKQTRSKTPSKREANAKQVREENIREEKTTTTVEAAEEKMNRLKTQWLGETGIMGSLCANNNLKPEWLSGLIDYFLNLKNSTGEIAAPDFQLRRNFVYWIPTKGKELVHQWIRNRVGEYAKYAKPGT